MKSFTLLLLFIHFLGLFHEDEEFRVLVIPGHTKVPEKKREVKRARKEVRLNYFTVCHVSKCILQCPL
jgi:hypothetical protein